MADAIGSIKKYSSQEIDDAYRNKYIFENEFMERWESEKLDAIICPAYYHAGFKHEDENELSF